MRLNIGSRRAPRQHDVKTFLRFGIQARDLFGPVLQVAIHHHCPLAVAMVQPGGDAVVLAEIAAELDAFDPTILFGQALDDLPRPVTTAIFHQHDLEIRGDGLQ